MESKYPEAIVTIMSKQHKNGGWSTEACDNEGRTLAQSDIHPTEIIAASILTARLNRMYQKQVRREQAKLVAIELLAYLRGYSEEEVLAWIDETNDDYRADLASDYAQVTSALFELVGLL